jgi:hypothetical protein
MPLTGAGGIPDQWVAAMTTDPEFDRMAFDPESTSVLIAAFEGAWDTVRKSGSPLAGAEQAAAAREVLARHLIERVQSGERDPQKLIAEALVHLTSAR